MPHHAVRLFGLLCGWQYDERLLWLVPRKSSILILLTAIAGGEIVIDCEGFDTSDPSRCAVTIGDSPAQIVALGPRRVLAIVPETKGGKVEVRLSSERRVKRARGFSPSRRNSPAIFIPLPILLSILMMARCL